MQKTGAIEKRVEKLEAAEEVRDGIPEVIGGHGISASERGNLTPEKSTLMEQVVEKENMARAYQRVKRNKGAAGIDNMVVEELESYLREHWSRIKRELREGRYKPQAVKVVYIPKVSGGRRQLGIPTVVDRMIQQALMQVLSPIFEAMFSEGSYGFRAGRNAQMAVKKAQEYQRKGKRWVVDIDLAAFFDEVNHDRLISRIRMKVNDRLILKIVRRYLQSGVMIGGVTSQRRKGTPQGSPLSPLLSNIVLDELDKELEWRKLSFCRYADDCNIYVRSKKAAERVMTSIKKFIEDKLKLKVNEKKSTVGRPWKRKFLGYSFRTERSAPIRIAPETINRFKKKLKQLFREGRGRNVGRFIKELKPVIRGWIAYFSLNETKHTLEELDEWIRRRLRLLIWRQWKRPRTRYKRLLKRGLENDQARRSAYNGRGAWWNSGASHMNMAFPKRYFERLELISLLDKWREYHDKLINRGTAVYGTVRTVV